MKNYNKGFIPLIIVALIALVSVGVGVGIYSKNKISSNKTIVKEVANVPDVKLNDTVVATSTISTTTTSSVIVKKDTTLVKKQQTNTVVTSGINCGVSDVSDIQEMGNNLSVTFTQESGLKDGANAVDYKLSKASSCFFEKLFNGCSAATLSLNDSNNLTVVTMKSVPKSSSCTVDVSFNKTPTFIGVPNVPTPPNLAGKSMQCIVNPQDFNLKNELSLSQASALFMVGILINISPSVEISGPNKYCSGTAITAVQAQRQKNLLVEAQQRNVRYGATPLMCKTVTNLIAAKPLKPFFGPKIEVVDFIEGGAVDAAYNWSLGTYTNGKYTINSKYIGQDVGKVEFPLRFSHFYTGFLKDSNYTISNSEYYEPNNFTLTCGDGKNVVVKTPGFKTGTKSYITDSGKDFNGAFYIDNQGNTYFDVFLTQRAN